MLLLLASWAAGACAVALCWLWLQTRALCAETREREDRRARVGVSCLLATCASCLALHFLAADDDAGVRT